MSSHNGVWLADGKIIGFGGMDLSFEPHSEPIDDENEIRALFSLSPQNEVIMSISLTNRQMENMWVVYHHLRLKLAPCPSKRVYHNAFRHNKARIRQKNRNRAARLIERMNRK